MSAKTHVIELLGPVLGVLLKVAQTVLTTISAGKPIVLPELEPTELTNLHTAVELPAGTP